MHCLSIFFIREVGPAVGPKQFGELGQCTIFTRLFSLVLRDLLYPRLGNKRTGGGPTRYTDKYIKLCFSGGGNLAEK